MVGSNSTSTDAPVVYNIIPVPPPPTALTFVNITVPVVTWTVRFPSALLTDASYSIFASNYTTLVGAGAGSSSFVPTSAPGYILSATAGSVIYSSEVDYYPGTSGAAQASALVTSLASPSTFFAANAAFLAYGGTPTMLVAPTLTYQSRLVASNTIPPPPPPSYVNVTVPVVTWQIRFPSALLTDGYFPTFQSNYSTYVSAGSGSNAFAPSWAPGYVASALAGSVILGSEVDYYPGFASTGQANALIAALTSSPTAFFGGAASAFLAYGGSPAFVVAPTLTFQSRSFLSSTLSPPPPPLNSTYGSGAGQSSLTDAQLFTYITVPTIVGGLAILAVVAAYLVGRHVRRRARLAPAGGPPEAFPGVVEEPFLLKLAPAQGSMPPITSHAEVEGEKPTLAPPYEGEAAAGGAEGAHPVPSAAPATVLVTTQPEPEAEKAQPEGDILPAGAALPVTAGAATGSYV